MSTTPLPPLYARWIEQSFGGPLPSEDRAPCLDCTMCGDKAERDGTPPDLRFNPSTKCCTYHPDLPSYLVGALLADATPGLTGKPLVEARVRDGRGVTPLGVFAGPDFSQRYEANKSRGADTSLFGRAADMVCPYYNAEGGGLCGVWLHRNAVCSTWFCKHHDGAAGKRFWEAVVTMLNFVEQSLTTWCAIQLDLDAVALAELYDGGGTPRSLNHRQMSGLVGGDGKLDAALARRVWGAWHGRELDFYRRCSELVAPLGWNDVLAIGGPRLALLDRRVRTALPQRDEPEDFLCKGQFAVMPIDGGRLRVRTAEASNEPIDLPADVVQALSAFDGRPTGLVTRVLGARGIVISERLLRDLQRRGVLVPPDGRDVPPNAQPKGPLTPEDQLQFFRGYRSAEPSLVESVPAPGKRELTLSCGGQSVTFDDPAGFRLARELFRRGNGFRAGEAAGWLGAVGWEQVRPLLEALVAGELLQRVPPEGPPPVRLRVLPSGGA